MNKHLKKLISLLGILLIAAMLSSGDFAYAFLDYEEGELILLQEGDFDLEYSEVHSQRALIQSAEEKIYNGLLNVSSSINIYTNRIPIDDAGALLSNVINDHPDLFYVSSTYRTSTVFSSSYVYEIIPYYSMSKSQIEEARTVFNRGVSNALSNVDSSMNDIQKALTIHDYMCDMATYPDLGDSYQYDDELYHSAYGFFLNGNAVCAGYTLAFSYLMHELGIQCEYVSSAGMQHAWNKVCINGSWYNVDITYDNFDMSTGQNTLGSVHHCFFLKSDSYFAGALGLYHFDGKTYDTCNASSTAMDEYFWDEVNSRIYTLNGDYYFINANISRQTGYLTKRTVEGAETKIGSYFSSATTSGYMQAYDSNGVIQSREYDDILIRIVYLDGRFYVSSNQSIYSLLLTGKRYEIARDSYYINGLSVRDKNIVYNIYGDKNAYCLDKENYFKNNITTPKGGYHNYPDTNNDGYVNAKDYAQIIAG